MASGDRKVEEELARHEYRTKLEGKTRRELQSLAKDYYFIPANLKSNAIIDEILRMEYDDGSLHDDSDVPYQTRFETMEAVRSLMKRINEKSSKESGAKCIFDCVMKVEAEMSAAVEPAAMAVKAMQQVSGVESVKTGTNKPVGVKSEPAVVKAVQKVNKPVGIKPAEPSVNVESSSEAGSLPLCLWWLQSR